MEFCLYNVFIQSFHEFNKIQNKQNVSIVDNIGYWYSVYDVIHGSFEFQI